MKATGVEVGLACMSLAQEILSPPFACCCPFYNAKFDNPSSLEVRAGAQGRNLVSRTEAETVEGCLLTDLFPPACSATMATVLPGQGTFHSQKCRKALGTWPAVEPHFILQCVLKEAAVKQVNCLILRGINVVML